MRSLKFVTLTLVVAMLFSLSVFSSPAHAQKKLVVGFAQTGSESGWRTAFTNAMKVEAEKEGIDLKFSDGQQKQEVQIQALRSFIAQKVDAILLAPIVETGWDAVLKEAKDAKIPVILVDRGVKVADDSLYVTRVAADFNHEGRLAASWLAAAAAGTKWAGGCNIVELQGTVGSSAALDRMKGFSEVIALFPTMKIVATQSGDFTRDGGKKVMEGFIKSQNNLKDICAVWAHNDDMLLGAIQAMKEAGIKSGKDGILTISVDGVTDIFKAMSDGDANASVELIPDLGPLAFQAVKDTIDGKTVEKRIVMPSPMWFPDTAADQYAKRSAAK
jgi:galactofuranose transport system substrate-binding protein